MTLKVYYDEDGRPTDAWETDEEVVSTRWMGVAFKPGDEYRPAGRVYGWHDFWRRHPVVRMYAGEISAAIRRRR